MVESLSADLGLDSEDRRHQAAVWRARAPRVDPLEREGQAVQHLLEHVTPSEGLQTHGHREDQGKEAGSALGVSVSPGSVVNKHFPGQTDVQRERLVQ